MSMMIMFQIVELYKNMRFNMIDMTKGQAKPFTQGYIKDPQ